MKTMQWTKLIFIGCTLLTLVACHPARRPTMTVAEVNEANAAYAGTEVRSSGLGDEARFAEQANAHAASQRVYYFDFDSNVVHDVDKPAIMANANYLLRHPRSKVLLEGHCDPRGSREYNIGLGERRAKAVAVILTSRGVSPKQIRLVSYGAQKLAVPGHTEAAYRLDRRVVLVYLRR